MKFLKEVKDYAVLYWHFTHVQMLQMNLSVLRKQQKNNFSHKNPVENTHNDCLVDLSLLLCKRKCSKNV